MTSRSLTFHFVVIYIVCVLPGVIPALYAPLTGPGNFWSLAFAAMWGCCVARPVADWYVRWRGWVS